MGEGGGCFVSELTPDPILQVATGKPREESVRQAGVAVVECKEIDCLGHDSSSAWAGQITP
jgi:hypothetical protein